MIELLDIEKRVGGFHLGPIDLRIEKGEYFFLLGPSGSGKTVLLELIAGIHSPDHGRILIDGKDAMNLPIERRNVGYVCQDPMLFPFLNVEKNIGFGLAIRRYPKDLIRSRVEEVAGMLGISHILSRDVERLSGGEKQRVSLARALVTDPQILLLDEPLSKLDAKMAYNLGRELEKIHRELGITMVQVTHNQAEARMLADRIAIIKDGEIIEIGGPDEIFYTPGHRFTADFLIMENIFDGGVRSANGEVIFEAEDLEIILPHHIDEGPVTIGIRPEDIEIVEDAGGDILSGRVIDLHPNGNALYRIYVKVKGLIFAVDMMRHDISKIKIGQDVNLYIKPEAVRILR